MSIKAIWAQARDAQGRPVIGRDGDMPWHLPEDLAHFQAFTSGNAVVMGRRTWESLPERFRPLTGRVNVVITRSGSFEGPDAVVGSLSDALAAASRLSPDADTWIIGGGRVYADAMPLAQELIVTEIDLRVDGDTYAPAIDPGVWRTADPGAWETSRTGPRYRFVTYVRH